MNRLDRSVLLSIRIPTHHGRSEHLRTVSLPVLLMPYPLVGPLRALQAQGLGTRAEDA